MRIAVISDTHDRLPGHVPGEIKVADEIWHLGDVVSEGVLAPIKALGRPLKVVRGNCDPLQSWPLALAFEAEGFMVQLVHIPPDKAPAGVNVLLHGHTHVPRNEMVGATRFLNPGCITRPNRGAPASYAWLTLKRGEALGWELVRV